MRGSAARSDDRGALAERVDYCRSYLSRRDSRGSRRRGDSGCAPELKSARRCQTSLPAACARAGPKRTWLRSADATRAVALLVEVEEGHPQLVVGEQMPLGSVRARFAEVVQHDDLRRHPDLVSAQRAVTPEQRSDFRGQRAVVPGQRADVCRVRAVIPGQSPISTDDEPSSRDNGPTSAENEPSSRDNGAISADDEPSSRGNDRFPRTTGQPPGRMPRPPRIPGRCPGNMPRPPRTTGRCLGITEQSLRRMARHPGKTLDSRRQWPVVLGHHHDFRGQRADVP
jgi:hypothetical protein